MHGWAMRGGLALLSALPERFTARIPARSLLLRWMLAHIRNDGLHLSPARDAAGLHTWQRLSVLLPERFDTGWGSAPSAVPGSSGCRHSLLTLAILAAGRGLHHRNLRLVGFSSMHRPSGAGVLTEDWGSRPAWARNRSPACAETPVGSAARSRPSRAGPGAWRA